MNIVKLLAIVALIYVVYKISKMFRQRKLRDVNAYQAGEVPVDREDLVQDPYCKTYVPKSQAYVREISGEKQYFCGQECCDKYLSEKR